MGPYRQHEEGESGDSQDEDLLVPLALRVQPPAVRSHEVGPHDKTEEENRSKREEDLPDQAQDPQDLHGDAGKERETHNSPQNTLKSNEMTFHSFLALQNK